MEPPRSRLREPRPRGRLTPRSTYLPRRRARDRAGAVEGRAYRPWRLRARPVPRLLYLPAAAWAARTRLRATVLSLLLAAESLALAPLWMSATNTWWLGRHNPTRFALGDTNLEYHQNFLALAAEMERRGIDSIGVAMPAVTAAELAAYLPRARPVTPRTPIEPGWYALNVTVERVAPAVLAADPADLFRPETFRRAARDWSGLAAEIAGGEDHGYAAGTFHLYRVPEPPPL